MKITRRINFIFFLFSFQFYCIPCFAFSFPVPVPGENQSIAVSGSTVQIKGFTDQGNKAFVNGREMSVGKDGVFGDRSHGVGV